MKKYFLLIIIIVLVFLSAKPLFSQSQADIRINEVLVYNDSGVTDSYNKSVPWIELFNTAYNYVNIGGCYLSNDPANPSKFKIIKGAANSIIQTRSYLLFWADNDTTKGIDHLNFTLKEGDFLGFYDSDGNLVDSLRLKNQKSNISFGAFEDGSPDRGYLKENTPNGTNVPDEKVTSSQKFKKLDPYGGGMAIIAMTVVFSALIILYLVFRQIGLRFQSGKKRKELIKQGKHEEAAKLDDANSGEVYAAIGMAMYMYSSEMHDIEEAVLTINKVSRSYSPWSSKIYSLRQTPK